MVVDTSVVLHVAFAEPGWEGSVAFLLSQQSRLVAAPSVVEAQAVLAGRTRVGSFEVLQELVGDLMLEVVPFTVRQAGLAQAAYLTYGKGQGHRAQLNYGDVLSYALAKDRREKLVFVGDDFNHTDLDSVRLPLE
ncbi:MAG: type II toxin-antitoxin system VapC family toxin [Trueperaceae bacterium]